MLDINTKRLRVSIGILGTILPWLVALLVGKIPCSISETYYTYEAGPVFVMTMAAAASFLYAYKGYKKIDDIVNTLAAICAVGICLFPCDSPMPLVGTFQLPERISVMFHNSFAIMFFLLLAFNSLFLFTKHGSVVTRNKKIRNIIYIVCGTGMLASFGILLLPWFRIQIWLTETIALFFFGVSFLTKADCFKFLFADPKE